jgi:aryl-alcohol dehydrogenase-like predicted oxidoreductase
VARLGNTGLDVFPLCLGANVFGWTADEPESRDVLSAYTSAGGNFIDTANSYLVEHGRSEQIIGRWMAEHADRGRLVVATKVGGGRRPELRNLRPETLEKECEASLERLQTGYIDLYYAHHDDPGTPLEDSLATFDGLVKSGRVRHIGASNYTAERLASALKVQEELGLTRFTVLQPHYNLVEREFEHTLLAVAEAWDLAVVPYYGLASGFLTGKYRPGQQGPSSPRAERARGYLGQGGHAVLEALDEVAGAHATTVAAVALAWLLAQPRVAAPIASARTPGQLSDLLPAAGLHLTGEELALLSGASRPA